MSTVRLRFHTFLLAVVALILGCRGADANGLRALKPGEFVVHGQTVPSISCSSATTQTRSTSRPSSRSFPRPTGRWCASRSSTGSRAATWGWSFASGTGSSTRARFFENQFFAFLKRTGVAGPPTAFQEQYNEQDNNVLDVDGPGALHRRADGRALSGGPARRRAARLHDLLHQLVRPERLQVPRLHEDRRTGSRHELQLRPAPRPRAR